MLQPCLIPSYSTMYSFSTIIKARRAATTTSNKFMKEFRALINLCLRVHSILSLGRRATTIIVMMISTSLYLHLRLCHHQRLANHHMTTTKPSRTITLTTVTTTITPSMTSGIESTILTLMKRSLTKKTTSMCWSRKHSRWWPLKL